MYSANYYSNLKESMRMIVFYNVKTEHIIMSGFLHLL